MIIRKFVILTEKEASVSIDFEDTCESEDIMEHILEEFEQVTSIGAFISFLEYINKLYKYKKALFYKEKPFDIDDYRFKDFCYVKNSISNELKIYVFGEEI